MWACPLELTPMSVYRAAQQHVQYTWSLNSLRNTKVHTAHLSKTSVTQPVSFLLRSILCREEWSGLRVTGWQGLFEWCDDILINTTFNLRNLAGRAGTEGAILKVHSNKAGYPSSHTLCKNSKSVSICNDALQCCALFESPDKMPDTNGSLSL